MPSRKRQVFDCLDKRTLLDLSKKIGLKGMAALNKDEIINSLSGTGSANLDEIPTDSITIDWTMRKNVRAQMRVIIKRILRNYSYRLTSNSGPQNWYWNRLKCCVMSGFRTPESK